MFEYVLLVAFVLTLSSMFFLKKQSRIVDIIFIIICFGALFFISSVRFLIGDDYIPYSRAFFRMGMEGFDTLSYGRWEIGFVLLSKTACWISRDIRIYLAIVAFISLAGPFFIICKYSKKVWLSVLLYINLYFFYLTMNFLRQSLAVSITLFAFPFLLKKKIFPYIIPYMAIVALASTFHRSAWLMIPIYFLAKIKVSYIVPAVYAAVIVPAFLYSNSIIETVAETVIKVQSALDIDFLARFAYDHYRNTVFWQRGIYSFFVIIPSIVIASCIFFCIAVKFPMFAKYDRKLAVYVNLMFFGYIFLSIMVKHAILERVTYYAYIYVILYIPEFIVFLDNAYKRHFSRKIKKLEKETKHTDTAESAEVELTESVQENIGDVKKDTGTASNAVLDIRKKYVRRRKIAIFCITAAIVIGTTAYNFYGVRAGARGVHGVYPYQTWLYEAIEIFGK